MNNPIFQRIAQATELTRAGRLKEATELIQNTLQGLQEPSVKANNDTTVAPTHQIIDVTAEVIDESLNPTTLSREITSYQTLASDEAQTGKEQQRRTQTKSHPSPTESSTPLWKRLREFKTLFPQLKTRPQPVGTPAPQTAKGQFIEGFYASGTQTRSYKLYIPSGYTRQALPLVVMLHGCTQSPDDFAAGTRMNLLAEEELFFVLYPAQVMEANSSKCWNWFKVGNQQRDRGEPSIIAGITEQVVSTYHLDRSQVYVSGLSAGGAMAAIMGICYPDVYAAVGIHSGLPYGVASDLPGAFAAMQNRGNELLQQKDNFPYMRTNTRFVPIIVFHGDRDTTVHPLNSEKIISQWAWIYSGGNSSRSEETLLRVRVIPEQVKNGHAYTRFIYYDLEGLTIMERWLVQGAGHGWSGGSSLGSFTDLQGPNASQEMLRFFREHPKTGI